MEGRECEGVRRRRRGKGSGRVGARLESDRVRIGAVVCSGRNLLSHPVTS